MSKLEEMMEAMEQVSEEISEAHELENSIMKKYLDGVMEIIEEASMVNSDDVVAAEELAEKLRMLAKRTSGGLTTIKNGLDEAREKMKIIDAFLKTKNSN